MKMPPQKPGRSFQSYATPRDFLEAVKRKFAVGGWAWDLAATAENTVTAKTTLYFGPDHHNSTCRDALAAECDWTCLNGDLWLNPPYADIAPWAAKCAASAKYSLLRRDKNVDDDLRAVRRIFFLVPAAVGSNWCADHVDGKARVVFFRPRLSFDGVNAYPKDCLLAIYGEKPGYECWRWR